MPKVQIIDFTGMHPQNGTVRHPEIYQDRNFVLEHGFALLDQEREFAARKLVFTKQTRLNMNGARFAEVLAMPWSQIEKELDYMAGTIPSSWEFVDVTFTLQHVSRACAQQITRTRFTPMDSDIFGSYAMQSFRVEELTDLTFHLNPAFDKEDQDSIARRHHLMDSHTRAVEDYTTALRMGISQQDARGLLPMDTHCNLVVKFNLRQLVDMLRTRDESLRVQGEYGDVAHQMKMAVLYIWPWAKRFFEPKDQKAIKMIEEVAENLRSYAGLTDFGEAREDLKEEATMLAKAADLLKK